MLSPGQTSISRSEMPELKGRKALSMNDEIKARAEMIVTVRDDGMV
jgi:hypothetical protein